MILTFYSYKGGVGRTMALANIAELFYQAGLKVLMVDWDVEAPGLERFFQNKTAEENIQDNHGIVDMIVEYKKLMELPNMLDIAMPSVASIKRHLVPLSGQEQEQGKLWLLPAGRRSDGQFANTVITFDLDDFYLNWSGKQYFDVLRERFLEIADVVLIDSTTGETGMGGVCTYHLADIVMMLCAPNKQNLAGIYDMAQRFVSPDVQKTRGRPLKVVVVPARVERDSRLEVLRNEFQQAFTETFKDFNSNIDGLTAEKLWDFRIPYTAKYAVTDVDKDKADASEMIRSFQALFNILHKEIDPNAVPLELETQPQDSGSSLDADTKAASQKADRYQVKDDRAAPPTGTLGAQHSLYIERAGVDDVAHQALHNQPQATLTLIGPRQIGKSSLSQRLIYKNQNKRGVFIDFQQFEFPELFEDFLKRFCASLSDKLDISPEQVERKWVSLLSPQMNCTNYIGSVILEQIDKPLMLVLDEVDKIRHFDYATAFFSLLRSWHNKGQSERSSNFTKLSIVLNIATSPERLIQNLRESPFNVGTVVTLRDFDQTEVEELYRRYPAKRENVLPAIWETLAGHPFLTQQALYHTLVEERDFDDLVGQALDRQGPFESHLKWAIRLVDSDKVAIVQGILQQQPIQRTQHILADLMVLGIIKWQDDRYQIRNLLYQQYFKKWLT